MKQGWNAKAFDNFSSVLQDVSHKMSLRRSKTFCETVSHAHTKYIDFIRGLHCMCIGVLLNPREFVRIQPSSDAAATPHQRI